MTSKEGSTGSGAGRYAVSPLGSRLLASGSIDSDGLWEVSIAGRADTWRLVLPNHKLACDVGEVAARWMGRSIYVSSLEAHYGNGPGVRRAYGADGTFTTESFGELRPCSERTSA